MKRGIVILIACSLLVGCSSNEKKTGKPTGITTISAPYELLLVANKDWMATSDGMELMELLKSDVEVLPQKEPNFKVININPSAFKKQFRGYAEILNVEINKKYTKPELLIARNVYAHPQVIVTLQAHDSKQMADFVGQKGKDILRIFINAELNRETLYLNKTFSHEVMTQAEKQFGCKFHAPKDINSIKVGNHFFWASSMNRDNMLNVCMYEFPLYADDGENGELELSLDSFLVHRNTFMKENVTGDREDRYMTTQPLGLQGEVAVEDGKTILQVRGLWEMENDAMGGPFVSYTWIDSETQKVMVAEGFVYAPQKKKRELIRELEASLKTIKPIKR